MGFSGLLDCQPSIMIFVAPQTAPACGFIGEERRMACSWTLVTVFLRPGRLRARDYQGCVTACSSILNTSMPALTAGQTSKWMNWSGKERRSFMHREDQMVENHKRLCAPLTPPPVPSRRRIVSC